VPSDSALKTRPQFKTVANRTVYGGGGIYPDVVVKDPPNLTRAEVDFITKRVGFEFATHWVTRHPGQKWTEDSFSPAFKLSPEEWTTLKGIFATKKLTVSDSVWTAEKPFIMRQVRAELASATLGALERYRIAIEDDPQLNAALDMFPKAQQLMAAGAEASKKAVRR
jgi:carboxyl-terminal processing protease